MSKSNFLENQFLDSVFGGNPITQYATVYIALHTASPGDAGGQTTNEATFGGYARLPLDIPTDFTVLTNQATNANDIVFSSATSAQLITHFSLGVAPTGAGNILYYGTFNTPIPVDTDLVLIITQGNLTISED